jgi:hypothetical protein
MPARSAARLSISPAHPLASAPDGLLELAIDPFQLGTKGAVEVGQPGTAWCGRQDGLGHLGRRGGDLGRNDPRGWARQAPAGPTSDDPRHAPEHRDEDHHEEPPRCRQTPDVRIWSRVDLDQAEDEQHQPDEERDCLKHGHHHPEGLWMHIHDTPGPDFS